MNAPFSQGDMRAVRLPADHPPVKVGRIGVLLVNLGTPDGTDYWSMRRYLKEFLSDRRVIETPRIIWWPLLNGVILTTRPGRKGKDYASIWNKERDESPLRTITRSQAEKLAASLAASAPQLTVDWAMRYGNPSIPSRIEALQKEGCDRILLVPLYPQYAAATSATVCDKAFDALKAMRWQPVLRVAPPWADDPVYIEALASQLTKELAKLPFEPEVILASFHGVPKSYLMQGDPYHCQCHKTARLMRDALGLDEQRFRITFQSRFGPAEWLQPYTDKTVEALAKEGVRNLAVCMPGFTADCLETLEEIAGENAEIFHHNGGQNFAAIPCLNDGEEGMRVIEHVVRRELMGWI
ncbi:ferrochelatase [Methylopila capsulata]|uniref:Ferrochelatase n=1 Tax=Methylopila capsulata TaxID=61654 RepID=A0A9W6IVN8_9HYPH|nr:ferrochelatase [Methylopila capsulata]MBM7852829.1 ferrochelatase [Methylopila capsulata]GLK57038.1 ferrochelatase [Methylopila capsulata]